MTSREPLDQRADGDPAPLPDRALEADFAYGTGGRRSGVVVSDPSRLNMRTGTAMMELLLVLPLLLLILGLMYYVGRGMMRLQQAQVMSRYESWRMAARVPDVMGPHVDHATEHALMNQTFYHGTADSISFTAVDAFPTDAQLELVEVTEGMSIDARNLTLALFATLPNGSTATFSTRHRTPSKLGRVFDGPIQQQHIRLDHDWRFVNGWQIHSSVLKPAPPFASNTKAVRDVLFGTLHAELDGLAQHGNDLARTIRSLYSNSEGYGGPDVEAD